MMLRVLVTASTFPVQDGDGLPRFVFDLAAVLAEHCRVIALAPDAPGARVREQMGRVEVRRFTYFIPRHLQQLAYGDGVRENIRRSWLARFQIPSFLVAECLAIRRVLYSETCDLLNSHWLIPQGLCGAFALGTRRRIPHIVHVHAGDVYLLAKMRTGRAIARFVLNRTDHVFAAGSHVRETLNALVGWDSGAEILSMGVKTSVFGGCASEPAPVDGEYLVAVGRMVEKKGFAYLLRAMPAVLRRYPSLRLVIIGSGPEESRLRQECRELGIERSVLMPGRIAHECVVRYLRGARLAVVPSIVDRNGETEGMPTVVVEAMAAGLPVVGSAVDGIPDVIEEGVNGWLSREKDAEDLASTILKMLASPVAMSEAARRTAVEHDWSAVGRRYMSTFREVMKTWREEVECTI